MVGCEFVQEIEEKQCLIEIQTSVSNRCVQHSCIYDVVRTVPALVSSPQEKGSHIAWVWAPFLKCWKFYYISYL